MITKQLSIRHTASRRDFKRRRLVGGLLVRFSRLADSNLTNDVSQHVAQSNDPKQTPLLTTLLLFLLQEVSESDGGTADR